MHRLLLLYLISLMSGFVYAEPAHAQQQVNRCRAADGTAVFSDKPCTALGAVTRMPPAALRDSANGLYRHGCPSRLSELVGLLHSAIDAGDVNRLSSLYLWNDVPASAANQILSRLESIASRPLLDIGPVYPTAPAASGLTAADTPTASSHSPAADTAIGNTIIAPPEAQMRDTDTSPGAGPTTTTGSDDIPMPPTAPVRPRPTGLRLEQTLSNSSTPASTVLSLRRRYNCFWISF